jgi:hypothetical protein
MLGGFAAALRLVILKVKRCKVEKSKNPAD